MIWYARGGGIGSGFGCFMLECLSVVYGMMPKLSFTSWACPQVAIFWLEHTEVTTLLANDALYVFDRLNLDIGRLTHINLIMLFAQIISPMAASLLFDGAINIDFTVLLL